MFPFVNNPKLYHFYTLTARKILGMDWLTEINKKQRESDTTFFPVSKWLDSIGKPNSLAYGTSGGGKGNKATIKLK